MAILILGQHDNATLDNATLCAVSAARELPGDIHILIAGKDCRQVAGEAAAAEGVAKVIHVEHDAYENPVAEDLAPLIVAMADDYDYLMAASTTFGRNVMPRVAALLDTAQISEIAPSGRRPASTTSRTMA